MKLSDFKPGKKFWMSGKQYVCFDVATKCVIAMRYAINEPYSYIESTQDENGKSHTREVVVNMTPKLFKKLFPYSLEEVIIYHFEFPACEKTKTKFQRKLEKERNCAKSNK